MKEIHSTSNVFDAALLRLDIIVSNYEEVCISLSGGKGSTVLLHLAATVAKAHGKRLTILFIDQEAQHTQTIAHIQRLKQLYCDVIDNFYWIALPLTNENSLTSNARTWISWEDNVEWWRLPPADAITDQNIFPFYYYAMTERDFTSAFLNWLASGKTLAFIMGTMTNEATNDSALTQKS
ncbi:MAG: phosphoadenosine phosphosulfate reductase family protein [Symbiopectobacterium sp.]|uniref:phosphoadenosine phosphosulfate reductase domain-containing protein n=1 Tax=Symbiopectobacterium sp. TaxID=2952789 RepID=UPI0039ED4D85